MKLKNLIDMIDNRPTTRVSDILSLGSTARAGISYRPTVNESKTTRLKKKTRVRKDLQEVK